MIDLDKLLNAGKKSFDAEQAEKDASPVLFAILGVDAPAFEEGELCSVYFVPKWYWKRHHKPIRFIRKNINATQVNWDELEKIQLRMVIEEWAFAASDTVENIRNVLENAGMIYSDEFETFLRDEWFDDSILKVPMWKGAPHDEQNNPNDRITEAVQKSADELNKLLDPSSPKVTGVDLGDGNVIMVDTAKVGPTVVAHPPEIIKGDAKDIEK